MAVMNGRRIVWLLALLGGCSSASSTADDGSTGTVASTTAEASSSTGELGSSTTDAVASSSSESSSGGEPEPVCGADWDEGGGACSTSADCSLAGDCDGGACRCDAPYAGPHCATLALGSTRISLQSDTASFWGGGAVRSDDGRVHLFASRFTEGCGLATWLGNSECVHAVADDPLGPFEVQDVVLPVFCHNPTVRRDPTGGYVLYSIGGDKDPSESATACADGVTLEPWDAGLEPLNCVIRAMRADDPDGPWSEPVALTSAALSPVVCPTNPAPVFAEDGSVEMFLRAYDTITDPVEHLHRATMSSWDSEPTYADGPLVPQESEDAFVWVDPRRGTYHALFNNKWEDDLNNGGHAVSPDGITWTFVGPVFGRPLVLEDGTRWTSPRRERPQILWDDPCHGTLYTASRRDETNDAVFHLATPIGQLE